MTRRIISSLGLGLLSIACGGTGDVNDGAGGQPGSGGEWNASGGASSASGGTSNADGGTTGAGGTSVPGAGGDAIGAGGGSDATGGGSSAGGTPGVGGGQSSSGGSSGVGGDTGSGGGTPVIEPTLVTSGQSAWWQEGDVTVGGTTAGITVNVSQELQRWDGFGGTFNEKGWDALKAVSEADRDLAIRLLFSETEGCGFTYGRIPIGSSDYGLDRYSLAPTADDFTMQSFSIDRDRQDLIPYIKAAMAVKPDIRFWGSPWSPPPWMKDNNAFDRGNIKNNPDVLGAHALYLARFVEEYENEGIYVEAVHPQNEPGYPQDYPSCQWSPAVMTDYIKNYLGPLFAERLPDREVWLGTMSNSNATQIVSSVMGDATARGFVSGIGLQWGMGDGNAPSDYARDYQIPIMQTEHKCGNYPWESGTNQSQAPNDHAYAVESWGFFKNWIGKNVNSYLAWNMVLDTAGRSLDDVRPWAQNALIAVDRSSGKLVITPTYYVFRHLAQYVEPGAVRVSVQGGDALAFKNPDGSVVTILFNSQGQAAETTLDVGGTLLQFSIPGQGWATVNWQG